MKKKIDFYLVIFFVLCFSIANAQVYGKVFFFDFIVYRNDTVKLIRFEIGVGTPTHLLDINTGYILKIISIENDILFSKFIPVSFRAEALPYEGEEEYVVEFNESEQFLRLPYFPNADRIEIYHEDKLIFTIDVKKYICEPNGVCSGDENEINCPVDCKKPEKIPWIYLIVVAIIIFIIIIFWRRKTSKIENILAKIDET